VFANDDLPRYHSFVIYITIN